MNHTKLLLLIAASLLVALTLNAQPSTPAYDFQAIVQPGMTIGGHTFTPQTTIDAVALNDAGEVAFLAHWNDAGSNGHAAVFASQKIVAAEGSTIDGKYVWLLPPDSHIAINASGQIAYEAMYSDSREDAMATIGRAGIFVDNHLALTGDFLPSEPFMLSDDGQVVLKPQTKALPSTQAAPSAAQKKPGLLDRVGIKPPQLPKNLPIGIAPNAKTTPENQPHPDRERPPCPVSPFPALHMNGRGQMLIPVNLRTRGFILLLATPSPAISATKVNP